MIINHKAVAFAAGLALGAGSALAQTAPEVTLQQSTLSAEAQQNIGTAQLLFKLGQTQGQLAVLQEQVAAKDKWLKEYVEGINKQQTELANGQSQPPQPQRYPHTPIPPQQPEPPSK
jgi:hypothetical protein